MKGPHSTVLDTTERVLNTVACVLDTTERVLGTAVCVFNTAERVMNTAARQGRCCWCSSSRPRCASSGAPSPLTPTPTSSRLHAPPLPQQLFVLHVRPRNLLSLSRDLSSLVRSRNLLSMRAVRGLGAHLWARSPVYHSLSVSLPLLTLSIPPL